MSYNLNKKLKAEKKQERKTRKPSAKEVTALAKLYGLFSYSVLSQGEALQKRKAREPSAEEDTASA